jgi:hypothetical protein
MSFLRRTASDGTLQAPPQLVKNGKCSVANKQSFFFRSDTQVVGFPSIIVATTGSVAAALSLGLSRRIIGPLT